MRAKALLEDWAETLKSFVKVMPKDYARALQALEAEALATASIAAE
jgi:glutamate synthase (NADPH) large chain